MKYIIDLPDNCSWVQWVMTSDKDGHAYFDFKNPEDLTTLDKAIEEAYQKGLKEGKKQGADEAWEFIKEFGKLSFDKSHDVFGTNNIYRLVKSMSYLEAISKLKAYEESQKVDAAIKVGDEIKNTLELMNNAVGYFIEPTNNEYYRVLRYVDGKIDIVAWHRENCVRTGGHSYAVERMVGVMKGEQSCSSCEYSNDPDGVRCRDCCGYNKFKPKGSED